MADVEDYSTTAASNTDDFPENQAPSTVNDAGRETQADIAAMYQRTNAVVTAGGTADVITATFSPAHTSLVAGRIIVLQMASDNTTTTPTLNLDTLGAHTVTKFGNEALAAGDIQAGAFQIFKYDSANGVWELLNPATPAAGTVGTTALATDAVTSAKIIAGAVTASEIAADAVNDSEINWNFTTASNNAISATNWTVPAGMYWMYDSAGTASLEVNLNAGWQTVVSNMNTSAQFFVSDGTNVRIAGTSSSNMYYIKMA